MTVFEAVVHPLRHCWRTIQDLLNEFQVRKKMRVGAYITIHRSVSLRDGRLDFVVDARIGDAEKSPLDGDFDASRLQSSQSPSNHSKRQTVDSKH